jgi:hypothetical protein
MLVRLPFPLAAIQFSPPESEPVGYPVGLPVRDHRQRHPGQIVRPGLRAKSRYHLVGAQALLGAVGHQLLQPRDPFGQRLGQSLVPGIDQRHPGHLARMPGRKRPDDVPAERMADQHIRRTHG